MEKKIDDAIKAYQELNLVQDTTNYNDVATISSIDFRVVTEGLGRRRVQFEVRTQDTRDRNATF